VTSPDHDSPDPAAVVREMFARLSARDFEGVAALLADDVEFDLAYAPAMLPMPTLGRQAVKDLVVNIIGQIFDPMVLTVTAAYPCADPAMVVCEYASTGTVKHNGNEYANRYVGIFRVDGIGLVTFWREYHNPEEATRALGA
jgi:ketosteroid isomerase-like protein